MQESRTEEIQHLKEMSFHFPKAKVLFRNQNISSAMILTFIIHQIVLSKVVFNFAAKNFVLFDEGLDFDFSVSCLLDTANEALDFRMK